MKELKLQKNVATGNANLKKKDIKKNKTYVHWCECVHVMCVCVRACVRESVQYVFLLSPSDLISMFTAFLLSHNRSIFTVISLSHFIAILSYTSILTSFE